MSCIQRVDRSVRTSSTSDLASRIRATVSGWNRGSGSAPATSALLLDVSGSMCAHVGANVRAIDRLRELAADFTDVRRFEFSDDCVELGANDTISEPHMGTAMGNAFDHVKAHDVNHVIVLTDGAPDNEAAALKAANGLKVDVIYCGPPPAPPFLEKLARQTGGTYGAASLDALKALAVAVRGLLPSGTIQL